MSEGGVYYILNTNTGKCYIGSSYDIERRWRQHRSELRGQGHSNGYLQNAWDKYGEDSFKFAILETTNNKDEILDIEQYYLDNFKPQYNIAKDAKAPTRGRELSKETKEKISQAQMGEKNPMYGRTISDHPGPGLFGEDHPMYGKHRTEETKAKISRAQSGENNPSSKLTSEEVKQIKGLLRDTDLTQHRIADKFNISRSTVSMIKNEEEWTKITI